MEKCSKIEYVVNEEKRTVVAIMRDCALDGEVLIENDIGKSNLMLFWGKASGRYLINNTYRGKAVCSVEDKWDVELGKRIARNRMLNKYYKAKLRVLKLALKDINSVMTDVNRRAAYAADKRRKALNNEL